MDHADWVERQIAPAKAQLRGKVKRDKLRNVLGWAAAPSVLTTFQRRAFNVLGMAGGGIYNCPINWETVEWMENALSLTWGRGGGMSTWDYAELTRFVFLCHTARIRGSVEPASPHNLRIILSQRVPAGSMSRRHPNLAEAVAAFEAELPADSPVRYVDADFWYRHVEP
jgi:hypothetical protein